MERLSEAATAAAIRVVLMFLLFVFQMQSRTTDYDWLSKIQDFTFKTRRTLKMLPVKLPLFEFYLSLQQINKFNLRAWPFTKILFSVFVYKS